MMQLKRCSCLVSESKSVRVTQIRPAVLQGLYEKKGIPGMRGWSKTAAIYNVIVISYHSNCMLEATHREPSGII